MVFSHIKREKGFGHQYCFWVDIDHLQLKYILLSLYYVCYKGFKI